MELKILNPELDLLDVIDNFTSLTWIRRYQKSGEFELHCPVTPHTIDLLKKGNIIYKGNNEAAYIVRRSIELNSKGEEYLTVKGKFLTNYLNRRINWGRLIKDGTVESIMHLLVDKNCINPADVNRVIPLLRLGELNGVVDKISYQNSYGNISDCLESLSKSADCGFGILVDIKHKELHFNVYRGRNLTINQTINPPCVFSRKNENILSQSYIESHENYRNVALIGGAGEDEKRKLTSVGNDKALDRYELFVDAREISDTEYVDSAPKEIAWSIYEPMLLQKGNEKLSENKEILTFNSSVNVNSNLVYRQDFDLGDKVTCYDHKWKITMDTTINEIQEVYEGNKLSINVVFGDDIPTPAEIIKSKMR